MAVAGAGCAAQVETVPEAELSKQQLAVIEIDGAEVQFLEQRLGVPVVIAYSEPGQNPLADPSIIGMNVVEVYEHLTGDDAPIALHQAVVREHEIASELASPDGAEAAPDLVPQVLKGYTAEQFAATRCGGTQICHTNVTGTGEYQRRTRGVHGWVAPYRGEVSLQVRVKFVGGWENVAVATVPQDYEIRYYTSYGINREQKVKVHNADGDGYHWSLGW